MKYKQKGWRDRELDRIQIVIRNRKIQVLRFFNFICQMNVFSCFFVSFIMCLEKVKLFDIYLRQFFLKFFCNSYFVGYDFQYLAYYKGKNRV